MIWRSGSQISSITFLSANSGYFTSTGPSDSSTSFTAWWNILPRIAGFDLLVNRLDLLFQWLDQRPYQ
jgi:hypothetical protein